jgi:hypothetical protein
MNLEAAETYVRRHTLEALIVERNGEVLLERYGAGFDREKPHALYSGTKSFWGVTAVIARNEGLLSLDEPVSSTLAEWKDGVRSRVTLRQLLNLTSGIGFGGLGNAVPTVEAAIATLLKDEPGKTFTYGGIPLQVFGAVLAPQTRAFAAGVPDREGLAADRFARCLMAHAQGRNPALAHRRAVRRGRVVEVRPLSDCQRGDVRGVLRRFETQSALRPRLLAQPARVAPRALLRERRARASALRRSA